MRKVKKQNGFDAYVFERGDGALRRWAEALEGWRMGSPENRKLAHPREWYLDEGNLLPRPTLGLLSLAFFAEKLLWRAYRHCPDTRACAKAQRLFGTIRRKMLQMRYRKDSSGRVQRKAERAYMKSTVQVCCRLARGAFDAVEGEGRRRRTVSMTKALE